MRLRVGCAPCRLDYFTNPIERTQCRLLTSEELLQELVEVLARPKLRKYFQEEQVKELLLLISEQGKVVEPLQRVNFCRDPKDNIFPDVAIAGQCLIRTRSS